jgi:hypothetical protein
VSASQVARGARALRLVVTQLLALGLLIGCARQAAAPPVRRPAPVGTPLPAGLALAVRVDLGLLRGELGRELAGQVLLDAIARDAAGGEPSAPVQPLLGRALAQSDVLWLGFPSITQPEPESVLLLRGHFTSLAPTEPGARWSEDASGTATLELDAGERPGYARVYRPPGDELLAWGPSSAQPALERALRGSGRDRVMRPPERGAVSVAANPEPLLARYAPRYPELTERFRGLRRLEAFAEPGVGAWRADVTLDFDTPDQAREASVVAERLREAIAQRACAVGALARALTISIFERNLRVQAALLGPDLDVVRACVLGNGCCA